MNSYKITGRIPLDGYDFYLLCNDGHEDDCFYRAGGHCTCGWSDCVGNLSPEDEDDELWRDIDMTVKAHSETDALERSGIARECWSELVVSVVGE